MPEREPTQEVVLGTAGTDLKNQPAGEVEAISSVASWSIPVELAQLTDLILEGAHDFVGFEADEQTFASAVEAVVGIFEWQMDSYRALGLIATRKGSLAYSFRRLSES